MHKACNMLLVAQTFFAWHSNPQLVEGKIHGKGGEEIFLYDS